LNVINIENDSLTHLTHAILLKIIIINNMIEIDNEW